MVTAVRQVQTPGISRLKCLMESFMPADASQIRARRWQDLVSRADLAEHQQQGNVVDGLEYAAEHQSGRHGTNGEHGVGERWTEGSRQAARHGGEACRRGPLRR